MMSNSSVLLKLQSKQRRPSLLSQLSFISSAILSARKRFSTVWLETSTPK